MSKFVGVQFMEEIEIIDEERRLARRTNHDAEDIVWFAMSSPYCREMKAKELLDSKGIQNFVPMKWKDAKRGEEGKLIPIVHNMIFARTTKDRIQEVKSGVPFLQYRTKPEGGRNVPIIVPPLQMEQFMRVCQTLDEDVDIVAPGVLDLSKGERVRIVGGAFAGVEGVVVRIDGSRKKRVVVELKDVASAMTAGLEMSQLEKLA